MDEVKNPVIVSREISRHNSRDSSLRFTQNDIYFMGLLRRAKALLAMKQIEFTFLQF